MKERVTLTIEKELLRKVDSTIDNEHIKNRSHAVELLLRKTLRGQAPSTAIILAGGKDMEENIEVDDAPKTLLKVQGKPLLEHNIDLLKKYGVMNIIIAIAHKGEMIKEYFGDGSLFGVNISYVEEKQPLGTAGSLHLLKEQLTEPFIMMNGDELKNIDLSRIYAAHNRYESTVTIALTTVDDPESFGVAMLDGNNILRFVEKPSKEDAPSKLVNAGLYIMEPEVTKMVPEGFSTLEHNIFPILARQGKLFGYHFSGQWYSTATAEKLQRAEKEWKGLTN